MSYQNHTFLIRTAPARSAHAGTVCAEIRCPGNLKAKQVLRELGVDYTQLETWVHPVKGWKLLRFTASLESYLMLHEACTAPDEQYHAETQEHLATMALAAKAEALSPKSVKELKNLAKQHGIKVIKGMKKADLLLALMQDRSVALVA